MIEEILFRIALFFGTLFFGIVFFFTTWILLFKLFLNLGKGVQNDEAN